jgi:hypothetical protein
MVGVTNVPTVPCFLTRSPPQLLTLKPRDEERPGVKNVINYLERCLAARSKGILDVKGFSLPQVISLATFNKQTLIHNPSFRPKILTFDPFLNPDL